MSALPEFQRPKTTAVARFPFASDVQVEPWAVLPRLEPPESKLNRFLSRYNPLAGIKDMMVSDTGWMNSGRRVCRN
jgi:hypothetical protein